MNNCKIFQKYNTTGKFGNTEVKCTVVWLSREYQETRTTYKCTHLAVSVYIEGVKNSGSAGGIYRKSVSINKKTLQGSKLSRAEKQQMVNEAYTNAVAEYEQTLKNRPATVLYFDKLSGSGMIRLTDTGDAAPVHACNLKGAKTWYPETACAYLVKGEQVTVDYVHHHCGAIIKQNETNVHFDGEKWNSLDRDNLAFKCDDAGNATSGLL